MTTIDQKLPTVSPHHFVRTGQDIFLSLYLLEKYHHLFQGQVLIKHNKPLIATPNMLQKVIDDSDNHNIILLTHCFSLLGRCSHLVSRADGDEFSPTEKQRQEMDFWLYAHVMVLYRSRAQDHTCMSRNSEDSLSLPGFWHFSLLRAYLSQNACHVARNLNPLGGLLIQRGQSLDVWTLKQICHRFLKEEVFVECFVPKKCLLQRKNLRLMGSGQLCLKNGIQIGSHVWSIHQKIRIHIRKPKNFTQLLQDETLRKNFALILKELLPVSMSVDLRIDYPVSSQWIAWGTRLCGTPNEGEGQSRFIDFALF